MITAVGKLYLDRNIIFLFFLICEITAYSETEFKFQEIRIIHT